MKSVARISTILDEMRIERTPKSKLYSDNKAMIDFVHGNSVAKNVRHMKARMWYTREQYAMGKVDLDYMAGVVLPADKLAKLGSVEDHRAFTLDIMGGKSIDYSFKV